MRFFLFLIILFFFSKNVCSQTFEGHSSQIMGDVFNIDCKMPKNFSDLKEVASFINKELYPYYRDTIHLMLYCPVIQSQDEQCLIMYKFPDYYTEEQFEISNQLSKAYGEDLWPADYRHLGYRRQMGEHLEGITGTNMYNFNDYVTIWSKKESKKKFNADSVFVMDIPVPSYQKYRDKYTRCQAMFITRYDRAYVMTLWFFTEEGYKKMKQYRKAFSKTIWYKEGWIPNDELIQEAWINRFTRI